MRKSYIDNIRIICILLLFPFHAANCYNAFGELFYVWIEKSDAASMFIAGVYPWWMSLLFALAGLSSFYALQKRTAAQYAAERVKKLFIPLVVGLILLVPPQAYIGYVSNCGFKGSFLSYYPRFFTSLTDWSGYDGSFTPGHLWFILYLFVISLLLLPLMRLYLRRKITFDFGALPLWAIIPGGIIVIGLCSFIGNIGNKSIGDFAACFALGFLLLSSERLLEKLKKHSAALGIAWVLLIALRCVMWGVDFNIDSVWYIQYKALEWVGILAAVGLGGRYLNFNNGFTKFFAHAEFSLFYFHQTILVVAAFFAARVMKAGWLQFTLITIVSFVLTVLVYEIFKRFKTTCLMFGIKYNKQKGKHYEQEIKTGCNSRQLEDEQKQS